MALFALLACLLASAPAFAGDVILMLNMNYSSKELKALEAVAAARGQEVVMVPPREHISQVEAFFAVRDKLEKKYLALHPEWKEKNRARRVISDYMRVGAGSKLEPELTREFADEADEIRRLAMGVRELEERLGPMETQVRDMAAKLKREGKNVDTLVISSHSDGHNLSGETSLRLPAAAVSRLAQKAPEIFRSPRHVMLLGCYNMTDVNRFRWRNNFFPNASLLAGFGVRAPSRNNPMSARFITEVLGKADELDRQRTNNLIDPSFIDLALRKLASVANTESVLDYCRQLVESRPASKEKPTERFLCDMERSCEDQWECFREISPILQAEYMDLENLHKDPPFQDTGTELRNYYTTAQQLCHASKASQIPEDKKKGVEDYRTYMKEASIRLIYWWNVQKNFSTYFANDIADFEGMLAKLGVEERMPSLDGDTGRVEFVRAYNAVEKALRRNRASARARNSSLQETAEGYFHQMYYPLYALQGEEGVGDGDSPNDKDTLLRGAIPFHWIEPGGVLHPRTEDR